MKRFFAYIFVFLLVFSIVKPVEAEEGTFVYTGTQSVSDESISIDYAFSNFSPECAFYGAHTLDLFDITLDRVVYRIVKDNDICNGLKVTSGAFNWAGMSMSDQVQWVFSPYPNTIGPTWRSQPVTYSSLFSQVPYRAPDADVPSGFEFNDTIDDGQTYPQCTRFNTDNFGNCLINIADSSGANQWSGTIDYGDGSGVQPLTIYQSNLAFPVYSHVYTTEGTYTVTITLTNTFGYTGTRTGTVIVNNSNSNPIINFINATPNPVQAGSNVATIGSFTDDITDTHTATWNWGDGESSSGVINESNGSGTVTGSHTYTTAGVYQVTLRVNDPRGGITQNVLQYISVYNPSAHAVFSAGQQFNSPLGAFTLNPNLTGKVKFGLSYKYYGAIPTGVKQFNMDYNAANLHFNATSVNSLVISNDDIGILSGVGMLNGESGYTFLVTGSESMNTIRIKIMDSTGDIIYDTQFGSSDTDTPMTSINGHIKVR